MTAHRALHLNGFTFPELFQSEGLSRLDQHFLVLLKEQSTETHHKLLAWRSGQILASGDVSALLIDCAIHLERFLTALFNIEEEAAISKATSTSHHPISIFKKYFVLRRAKKELLRMEPFPVSMISMNGSPINSTKHLWHRMIVNSPRLY